MLQLASWPLLLLLLAMRLTSQAELIPLISLFWPKDLLLFSKAPHPAQYTPPFQFHSYERYIKLFLLDVGRQFPEISAHHLQFQIIFVLFAGDGDRPYGLNLSLQVR